jgi:hypothetical protein
MDAIREQLSRRLIQYIAARAGSSGLVTCEGEGILATSGVPSGRAQMTPKSFGVTFTAGSLAAIATAILLTASAEAQIQKAVKTPPSS